MISAAMARERMEGKKKWEEEKAGKKRNGGCDESDKESVEEGGNLGGKNMEM